MLEKIEEISYFANEAVFKKMSALAPKMGQIKRIKALYFFM